MARAKNSGCSHCGGPASLTGPRLKPGRNRYCMKPECRAAKMREARAAWRNRAEAEGTGSHQEARPCSCCHAWMPARAWRNDIDRPEGRWCRSIRCQKDKRETLERVALAKANATQRSDEDIDRARRFLQDDFLKRATVACPECGRPDAVDTWDHPHSVEQRLCSGTTQGSTKKIEHPDIIELARARWLG